jgi:hypothetical protein
MTSTNPCITGITKNINVIPERLPIGDAFQGMVLRFDGAFVLARSEYPDSEVIARGDLLIRYGVEILGKPRLSIVPGLIALDYGDMLTGEDAWHFLLKGSHLHPRADVIGYRNDGIDDMTVIKALDLAQPVHVLAYENAETTRPIARVSAIIADNREGIPLRLLEHLLNYPTITEWQAAQDG